MNKKYLCLHCNYTFFLKPEQTPRCPKCHRIHGLDPINETPPKSPHKKLKLKLIPLAILILLGTSYGVLKLLTKKTPEPFLSLNKLKDILKDTPLKPIIPFAPNHLINSFVKKKIQNKDPRNKAKSLLKILSKFYKEKKYLVLNFEDYPKTNLKTASKGFKAIINKKQPLLLPYEISLIYMALARSIGLFVMMAEAKKLPYLSFPIDPTGSLGYFVVVFKPQKAKPVFIDPTQGKWNIKGKIKIIQDIETVAHYFNHQAVKYLAKGKLKKAFELSNTAKKLAPSSAIIRKTLGKILLSSGGIKEGINELYQAKKIEDEPTIRHLLAQAHQLEGNIKQAQKQLSYALNMSPNFKEAQASLARILILQGNIKKAERILKNIGHNPKSPNIISSWIAYYMAKDKLKLALNKAKLLVSKTQSPNAYLILASLYQRLGKDEKMQQALKGAIQKSPDPERLKEIIKENFTPLEKTPDTLPRLQLKSKLLEKKEPSFRFKLREDTGLKLKMK